MASQPDPVRLGRRSPLLGRRRDAARLQWWTNFTTIEFTAGARETRHIAARIYGFDPQGDGPDMKPYIIAEIPIAVTRRRRRNRIRRHECYPAHDPEDRRQDHGRDVRDAGGHHGARPGRPPTTATRSGCRRSARPRSGSGGGRSCATRPTLPGRDDPEQWAEDHELAAKVLFGVRKAFRHGSAPVPPVPGVHRSRRSPQDRSSRCFSRSPSGYSTLSHVLAPPSSPTNACRTPIREGLFAERWYADPRRSRGRPDGGTGRPARGRQRSRLGADHVRRAAAVPSPPRGFLTNQAFQDRLIRFWYGFDHPPDPRPGGRPGARPARLHPAARRRREKATRITSSEASDFDAPIRPAARGTAGAVRNHARSDPAAMGGKSKFFVQGHGRPTSTKHRRGFPLNADQRRELRRLASRDALEATGNVSFQAELVDGASPNRPPEEGGDGGPRPAFQSRRAVDVD